MPNRAKQTNTDKILGYSSFKQFCLPVLEFRCRIHSFFFYKNVVFLGQAEYSYFSADFRL